MSTTFSSPALPESPPRKRRDVRAPAAALFVVAVVALGYIVGEITGAPGPTAQSGSTSKSEEGFHGLRAFKNEAPAEEREAPAPAPAATDRAPSQAADRLLGESAKLIKKERYDDALRLLQQNHETLKDRPRAYLQIGDALLGKKDYPTARDFFVAAIDRDPLLAEAYFGFAQAAEGTGDLESALGGMRSFIHVSADKDPFRMKIAQARSAIWEWESKLGRGPWGPTKGIPPGFTEAEVRREKNRGAGTRMPIPGTADENGVSQYEVKLSDRIPMYKK